MADIANGLFSAIFGLMRRSNNGSLLDHFVGAYKQRWWDG
jgi:hypothetical protein